MAAAAAARRRGCCRLLAATAKALAAAGSATSPASCSAPRCSQLRGPLRRWGVLSPLSLLYVSTSLPPPPQTLLHEMCHAAAWVLDHTHKPPHGPAFQRWGESRGCPCLTPTLRLRVCVGPRAPFVPAAKRASAAYPHRAVTTCHSFDVQCKYRWRCCGVGCGATLGRHSKSIDAETQRCGQVRRTRVADRVPWPPFTPSESSHPPPAQCGGRLEYLGTFKIDGTPSRPPRAAPSAANPRTGTNYSSLSSVLKGPRTPAAVLAASGARGWPESASLASYTEGRSGPACLRTPQVHAPSSIRSARSGGGALGFDFSDHDTAPPRGMPGTTSAPA